MLIMASALGVTTLASAQPSRFSAHGSMLSLQGQVIGPQNSPTLHSTIDLTGGDTVQWTSYLGSKLPGPTSHEGVLSWPAGQQWNAASFKAPQGVTAQWQVNGQWQALEPAAGQVVTGLKWRVGQRYTIAPPQEIVDVLDMSGIGDGYRVIPYKDRLFVVNHHAALGNNRMNPLKCRMATTGFNCPGWPFQGVDFRLTAGAVLDGKVYPDSTGYTTQNPLEGLNEATGELFVVVGGRLNGRLKTAIVCTNLNTLTSCGSWEIGDDFGRAISFNQIGNKFYTANNDSELVCFDVVKKWFCEGTETPSRRVRYGIAAGSDWANSVALGHRLFFMANLSRAGGHRAYCHDSITGRPCEGLWTPDGIVVRGEAGANPWLKADGSPRGVCTRTGYCLDLLGQHFQASANYVEFFEHRRSGWGYRYRNISAIQGSKVYAGSAGDGRVAAEIGCFDTAADQRCGSWPTTDADPYTSRFHPALKNCVMVLGHKSIAKIFDVTTGGKCSSSEVGGAVSLVLDPLNENFKCDAARARVSAWGKLSFSRDLPWGAGGIKGMKVRIRDKAGALLPAPYKPEREFAQGQYEMDLGSGEAAIPFSQFPVLQIELTPVFFGANSGALTFSADLGYVGDPFQVCAATTVPASPDCQTHTKVVVNSRQVGTSVAETLSAATLMSPGGRSSGYSAVSTATSARSVLRDLGPRDPKTHVLQGRWALDQFSGDLWAFGLTATGDIDARSFLSAQAGTGPAATRPMYVAKPASGGFMGVQRLSWESLSASQQDSLNRNLNGLPDRLGAGRVAYLRGTDGGFRARGGKTLGPVINSSPATLTPSATLGLSEQHHPGYTAYRASLTRPHPLALFGGNDGALHAYEVRSEGLREAWSFVPDVMLRKAAQYADPALAGVRANPYFVDNIPMVGHVNTGAQTGWRAVAVLTYGRGARGIAALDVSHADLSRGAGALFEYTASSDKALNDLGYIISQPLIGNALVSEQIVQLGDRPAGGGGGEGAAPRPAVLVGNGIGSNDDRGGTEPVAPGRAVLYAFYLDKAGATKWQRWAVDELWSGPAAERQAIGRNNGLSTPTPVDTDGDGVIDLVYAGDVQGNLWRFDLSKGLNSPSVTRLFKTTADQAITQAPFVTLNPQASGCGPQGASQPALKRCWQVVFSTGEAISPLMGTPNVKTQSIYGVLDKGQGRSLERAQLLKLDYAVKEVVQGVEYRALQPRVVDYAKGALGWVVDLEAFEHGVGAPRQQPTGLVMFSSIRPATPNQAINVCIGPRSWLNEVDPIFGVSKILPFDLNGDGQIDDQDRLQQQTQALPPMAMAVSGAQFGPPAVLLASSTQAQQMSLLLPSLGQDTSQGESWSGGGQAGGGATPGSNSTSLRHSKRSLLGRMSWREVY